MIEKINKYIDEINNLSLISNEEQNSFNQIYLSKSGLITQLFNEFKALPKL